MVCPFHDRGVRLLVEPIDADEARRRDAAWETLRRLWASSRLSSGGRLTADEFAEYVGASRHLFPLVMPPVDSFDVALALAGRFSLSSWYSMLLGACLVAGTKRLYTEDIGSPRQIEGIELINPFA